MAVTNRSIITTARRRRGRRRLLALALVVVACSWLPGAWAAFGPDGGCPLVVFVPFSDNGTEAISISGQLNRTNPGFSHMAAALIAVQQFNARNHQIVPQLANYMDCPVQLNATTFIDAGTRTHQASQQLYALQDMTPCAMAGPFNDFPALELSVMAQAAKIPLVPHRSFNMRVYTETVASYTTQVFPSLLSSAETLWSYLQYRGRTDFYSLLYAITDTGVQRREALELTWAHQTYAVAGYAPLDLTHLAGDTRTIPAAMHAVKETGYRTIAVVVENGLTELPIIAQHAETLGLNTPEYYWIFFGELEPRALYSNNTLLSKLLHGASWIAPLSGLQIDPTKHEFFHAWRNQGADMVASLNMHNPVSQNQPGYFHADDDFFGQFQPVYGSAFMFDSIMSIGIGACEAWRRNHTVDGHDHVRGIQAASFDGATGTVRFGEHEMRSVRDGRTVQWGVFNLLPETKPDGQGWVLSDLLEPGHNWLAVAEYVYRGGVNKPPPLRDQPEQNYITKGIRAFGLALMAFAMLMAFALMVWVYKHRTQRIVIASQPMFLYIVLLGAAMEASTILPLSFDEGMGLNDKQLDHSCAAIPWLFATGHVITYGALFAKLWRVNRVLQFARRKIEIKHVAWPIVILVVAAFTLLALWTAESPLQWDRVVHDPLTGESFGRCHSENTLPYLIPLIMIMLIPTLLTCLMAWKTKDVEGAFAEGMWIFIMIIMQLEVLVVATPVVVILRDVSTDGGYFGLVLMLWLFPTSSLCVVMLPKLWLYYHELYGKHDTTTTFRVRGTGAGRGGLTVTGVDRQSLRSSEEERRQAALNASSIFQGSNTPDRSTDLVDAGLATTPRGSLTEPRPAKSNLAPEAPQS